MSSPLDATVKGTSANAYLTVARANLLAHRRLYASPWTSATSTPDADGFLVNGAASLGSTSVTLDTGTGTWTVGTEFSFAGHETVYTVSVALTGAGTLQFSPSLTAAVADNEAINRHTANQREQAIMWSTLLFDEMMNWYGHKTTDEQALWFPATNIVNQNGSFFDFDTIPQVLEVATVDMCIHLLASDAFAIPAALGKGVSQVSLGPLKAKIDPSQQTETIPSNILSLLSDLGRLESEAQKGSRVVPLKRV